MSVRDLDRPSKFAFSHFPGKHLHLIYQHDRHAVAIAGGQIRIFVNIPAGEGIGGLCLDLLRDAHDHVAEVAIMPGKDGDINHG